jgi:hypothetical protein
VTADKIGDKLALTMNDAAVRLLALHDGLLPARVPEGIRPGLEGILGRGIVRRGQVVTWAGPAGDAEGAPAGFCDLTSRECFGSPFHLEDFVPVGTIIPASAGSFLRDACSSTGIPERRNIRLIRMSSQAARWVVQSRENGCSVTSRRSPCPAQDRCPAAPSTSSAN